jgi:hypothetical protein
MRCGSPGFQSRASTAKNGCGRNQSGPNLGSLGAAGGPSITYTRAEIGPGWTSFA